MRELYVIPGTDGSVLLTEEGKAVEVMREMSADPTGTVYLGKVDRIMKNPEAAFVDIGAGKDAFLPLKENSESFIGPELRGGMKVPVQIRREQHGSKGAFVSRDLVIPGTSMILMPMNRHIGVSAKITAEKDRKRLKDLGARLTEGKFGLVMRTAAVEAEDDALESEYAVLTEKWCMLQKKLENCSAIGPVDTAESTAERYLRDYGNGGIDHIVTSGKLTFETKVPVTVCEREYIAQKIRNTVKSALKRTVVLPHGGSLVIDPCEAMTVIDVNTASDTRGSGNGFLTTNLEACSEIAAQLRLRNISGIVIIDMIDMQTETEREQVLKALREAVLNDPAKTVIHGMTSLGLIEMTRKRTAPSVYEQWAGTENRIQGEG